MHLCMIFLGFENNFIKESEGKMSIKQENNNQNTENYKFFSHKKCEYFPCHKTPAPDDFNCLFCYCPLYALGSKCGGNFEYTADGIKSCMNCSIPHTKTGYTYILSKYKELEELAKL